MHGSHVHLTRELAARERIHRRATLIAIGAFLVASTSPVFVHHLSFGVDSLLAGLDHLGALCLTALHLLLAPVHRGFHVLLIAGVLYATWDRYRAWRLLQRSLAPLPWRSPVEGDRFWTAARDAALDPERVRVVDGLPAPALTAGWVWPVVYVASELARRLNADQLSVVLAHEAVHVQRRDPLRLSTLRFLAVTVFWIPALRRLTDDVADEAEVLADDHAGATRPLVLASALVTLARWRVDGAAPDGSVGLFQGDLLERRVRRLAGENALVRSHVTRRSLMSAALALSVVWSSGILVAHPMPSASVGHMMPHCEHTGQAPLSHLFCLGFPFTTHARCPHSSY